MKPKKIIKKKKKNTIKDFARDSAWAGVKKAEEVGVPINTLKILVLGAGISKGNWFFRICVFKSSGVISWRKAFFFKKSWIKWVLKKK